VRDYLVIPIKYASRFQREPGFNPFEHMRPKEVMTCRREIDRRERDDAALAKWHDRDIDNTKN
jgi:hypothetical protein